MGTSPGSFYVSLFIYCVAQSPQELSTGHKKVLQVKAGSCGVRVETRIIKREVGRQGETLQKGKKKKKGRKHRVLYHSKIAFYSMMLLRFVHRFLFVCARLTQDGSEKKKKNAHRKSMTGVFPRNSN